MSDFLRGLLQQPDRQAIRGLLAGNRQTPLQSAMQNPEYVGGALRDPQFYADMGGRLSDLLRGGVQDVLPTGTRTQKLADLLGAKVDPAYMQKMTDVGLAGMTVFAPNKIDEKKLAPIIDYMTKNGTPEIRAVFNGEAYQAIEGSHRLEAAKRLGLTPKITEVPWRSFVTNHDLPELPNKTSAARIVDYLYSKPEGAVYRFD
jgi:hypothetical protein